jgi:(2Fe-2S) ferredoxin
MERAPLAPDVHLFVCTNVRDASSPLGTGCGARGEVVYEALKAEVARRGAFRAIWVTRTHCIGICPRRGCTVACYPERAIERDVELADVPTLFARATSRSSP